MEIARQMLFICIVQILAEKDVSKSIILQKQYTLLTDLKYSEEELLANIKKNCKYEIRRSEREEAQVHFFEKKQLCENSEIIKRFETAYNQMFGEKVFPDIDSIVN